MKKSLLCAAAMLWAIPAEAAVEDLINAVKAQDLQAVRTLLANGENVNAQNELGNSALHYAIALDDADMARLLLDNGANMKLNNAKGWSPLTIAEKKKVQNVGPVLVENIQRRRDAALAAQAAAEQQANAAKAKIEEKAAPVIEPVATVVSATPSTPAVDNSANEELLKRAAVALRESKEAQKQAEADKESALKAQKSAEQKADALEKRIKELEYKLAAQAKPLPKPAPKAAVKASLKDIRAGKGGVKPLTKPQVAAKKTQPIVKKPQPQPAPKKIVLQKSSFSADMYAGDEEIIYCLDLLGQGENKYLAPAAAFFAAANGINEVRYNQITAIVDNFYKSASEQTLEQRRQQCSAVITPQDTVKQNQIIRSMNKAIGY